MDLQELFSSKEIKKKIDDEDLSQRSEFLGVSSTPKEVQEIQIDTNTPLSTILDDLSVASDILQQEGEDLYNSIVLQTPQDTNLLTYLDLIENYYWNPAKLITDTTALPTSSTDYSQLNNLELDMVQQYNNPSIMFLSDIRRVISEGGYISYLTQTAWKDLDSYSNSDIDSVDNLIRIHLFTEQERLQQKRAYLSAIKNSDTVTISNSFLTALVSNLNLSNPTGTQSTIDTINKQIKTLNSIKPYLKLALITSSYKWMDLKNVLNDIWGTYYNQTMDSYTKSFAMKAGSFINNGVFEVLNALEQFTGLDLDGVQEVSDFKHLVTSVLYKNLAAVEQELIDREVKENTAHHTRFMKLVEANKSSKIKKYLDLIDELILQLELFKANLGNTGSFNSFELNKMVYSLQEKLATQNQNTRKNYVGQTL